MSWDTKDATVAEIVDDIELQPTALVVRQHADDIGPLARLAQDLGPRDLRRMAAQAEEMGRRLGRDAFYSWAQSGGQIEGLSIDGAYALLPIWGRAVTRVEVVDIKGPQVTLRGIAIDILNITTVERDYIFTLAPAPGKYANKPDQIDRWNAMQTQSAASKAVRGAILGMLPAWIKNACLNAAKEAASSAVLGGMTLEAKAAEGIAAFKNDFGLTQAELESYLEEVRAMWGLDHLERMRALYGQLRRGETTAAAVRLVASKPKVEKQATAPRGLSDLEGKTQEPTVATTEQRGPTLTEQRKAMLDRLRHVGLDSVAGQQYGPISKWTDETLRGCEALIVAAEQAGADDDGGEP